MTEVDMASVREETELEQRLNREIELRDLLQYKIKDSQSELDGLVAKQPSRPREKISELDLNIAALERQRTITSIDLKDEREILKQIHRLERVKREVQAFEAHDKLIKEKKSQISSLKEKLRDVRANTDTLYTEFLLTKTANRVGCKKEELVGTKLVCPQEKLGAVIGKKGSNVRQLQATASVTVNVLKEGDVRIMGAPEALDVATTNLQKVIDAVEEVFTPQPCLITFLTSRHITMLKELSERHPNVRFSVQRQSETITMRGTPSDLDNLKRNLLALDLVVKSLVLPDSEAAHVVGKQGATVEGLVATYQTSIDVVRQDNGSSLVTLTGPTGQVGMALAEIEKLASEVRETTHAIEIDPVVKTALLENKGAGIQVINQRVNEAKETGFVSAHFDGNTVVLRGRAMHLPDAVTIVEAEIRRVEVLKQTLDVDPTIIPYIIGKGGETIKAIKDGKAVAVEVEKHGKIVVCGCDETQVDCVVVALKQIIAGNAVIRVNVDASLYKRMSLELLRSKSKTISGICKLSLDDEKCEFVLRGDPDKVNEASSIVREFLSSNYVEEVAVTAKDIQTLLRGGKNSKIMEIASRMDVKLNAERDRDVIVVRGEQTKVGSAVQALNQFLFGGNGVSVLKITLNEQLLGIVIGKGGKTKDELLKKYPNVSIAVDSKECTITLRGPESEADDCRVEVLKVVANAQVTESIELSRKTYQHLAKAKPREVVRDIPVQLNLSEASLSVRGYSADVADAIALLNDTIHGRYETRLVVPSPQFAQISNSFRRESSPLQRVMASSGASIVLDSSVEAIVFRGKKSQVKCAKQELMAFLDFLFGPSFCRIELSGPLRLTVGRMAILSEVSAVSGASVRFDRDTGYLLLFSIDPEKVDKARSMLFAKIAEASKLFFELKFDSSEDWIVSAMIGKKGSQISKLRKDTKCDIDVDSTSRTILVRSKDAELVAASRAVLSDFVDKLRRQNATVEISETDLPAFIGRAGVKITEFSDKYGVDAKIQKTSPPTIRFQGEESAVAAAKAAAMEWIRQREEAQKEATIVDTIRVRQDKVPVVIGTKGATIRSLETTFGCKVEVDRESSVVSVRGGNAEKRAATIAKIREILSEDGLRDADAEETGPVPKSPPENVVNLDEQEPTEVKPKTQTAQTSVVKAMAVPSPSDFPVLVTSPKKGPKEVDELHPEVMSSTTCSTVTSGESLSWSSVVVCKPPTEQKTPKVDQGDWKENAVNTDNIKNAFGVSPPSCAVAVNDS